MCGIAGIIAQAPERRIGAMLRAIEHRDGRRYEVRAGMSYHVADEDRAPHRLTSESGASVFIVD
jgi:asparagine synthetase B (glutamine-hydrolysing)